MAIIDEIEPDFDFEPFHHDLAQLQVFKADFGSIKASLRHFTQFLNREFEDEKTKGYWNKQRCADEALKFKTRRAFQTGSNSAYQIAL